MRISFQYLCLVKRFFYFNSTSDDNCTNQFTPNQVARMHCYLDLVYQKWLTDRQPASISLAPIVTGQSLNSVSLYWLPPMRGALYQRYNFVCSLCVLMCHVPWICKKCWHFLLHIHKTLHVFLLSSRWLEHFLVPEMTTTTHVKKTGTSSTTWKRFEYTAVRLFIAYNIFMAYTTKSVL